MAKLRLGVSLPSGKALLVPDDAVTQTFLVLGKRGSGKSNTAVVLAEEMHRSGAPFVVLDPIGAWWGLKSSFDGAGPGLPVYVFGGQHGDLPLRSDKGQLMAQVFISHRQSMVLDMKGWTGAERARFVTDFALWMLNHNDRVPSHIFLEEADAFIPQKPYKGEEAMLGAMDRLVRWGRQEGLGSTTISQRSAKINKDVTTQTEILIAHRTIGPQDRDVVRDWIKYHVGEAEMHNILETLATLPDGTAWVWSPDWLGTLQQVAFRRRETFDSAATPKLGEKRVQPKALAQVDIDKLQDQLAETIEQAKAEDPKELRKEIASLRRQLETRPPQTVEVERVVEKRVEVPVIPPKVKTALEQLAAVWTDFGRQMTALQQAHLILDGKQTVEGAIQVMTRPASPSPAARPAAPARPPADREVSDGDPKLGKAELAILSVLAVHRDGINQKQLAFWAGYSPKTSTLGVSLGLLRREGLVEYGLPLRITDRGMGFVPDNVELPPPPGPELIEYWSNRLDKGAKTVLRVMVDAHPDQLTMAEIAERSGYSPTTSTLGVALGRLRSLKLVEGFSVSDDLL